MKVLFAIGGTGEVSARTANKYYEKFGETLEYKNQFSFKTLLDEVKREKTIQRKY